MDCNTQKGLYFLIIGTIITMICSAITSISNFFIKDLEPLIIISIIGIVSLIGAIIAFIGAIIFLIGRKEFGEKHQKNVMNAVIIFIINFVLIYIFSIGIALMAFSAITSDDTIGTSTSSFTILIIIIGAFLGALIYYFALIDLENERGKNFLFAGIISSITISIITSFYLVNMLGDIFGTISKGSSGYSSLAFNQNFGAIGLLGIIPTLLYIYSFYIPYKRIKDGELLPIVPSNVKGPYSVSICPNCGKHIPFDAKICPYCGKHFEA